MLKELHISNLAVIEDTSLTFQSAYTALVGETGAGKSLIVSSLNLLLGERSDFSLIRNKEKKATVSALFTLDDHFLEKHPELKDYVEDHALILKRSLLPDHTSRCYISDTIVSQNELKRIASHLIDIHSQNSNSDILDEKKQLFYLSSFLSKEGKKAKEEFEKSYSEYAKRKKDLQQFLDSYQEVDEDYLNFQIAEIEKYHLKENEIEDLNAEYDSLKDYAKIQKDYDEFSNSYENENASLDALLSNMIHYLRPFKETRLEKEAEKIEEDINTLKDSLTSFDDSFSSLDFNPERLDEINERLYSLKTLQRKYGRTTKEILDKYQDYKKKLELSSSFAYEKENKEKEVEKAYQDAYKLGENLYQYQKEAATILEKAISKEMSDLGLRKNGFSIDFKKEELTSNGLYSVSFLVELNEGISKASLKKAASGGETSRLMLALKTVLNRVDPYDLVVFDEIDTGVSGKQASLIARKIASISQESEVLVISHLAQVVASCLGAIYIKKVVENNETKTKAKNMSEEEILSFIASMLSGDKKTEAARNQAIALREEYQIHG